MRTFDFLTLFFLTAWIAVLSSCTLRLAPEDRVSYASHANEFRVEAVNR